MAFYYRIFALILLKTITSSNGFVVEMIEASPKTVGGANTVWCQETQSLYYCNVFGDDACQILRYCPADDKVYCSSVDRYPLSTFIKPLKGSQDLYAVSSNHTINIVQWDGKSPRAKWIRTVFEAENCPEYETNIFIVAFVDPRGRLFAGTERNAVCLDFDIPTYGNLFRLSADEPAVTVMKPKTIRVSAGMAWDKKMNKFYFVAACDWNIASYDYCPHTGDLSNKQIVYNYTDGSSTNYLAGMTIDKKGCLYVASFGGSCVIKLDPRTGEEIYRIPFPCKQITAVTFAGKHLDYLLVATSSFSQYEEQSEVAGKLFKVSDLHAYGCETCKVNL